MLKLSPVQQRIIEQLKAPGQTPEGAAKALRMKVSTVYVQLGRVRGKDRNARSFHAMMNGLMANPNVRRHLKVAE